MNLREKLWAIPQGVKASFVLFLASIVTKGIAYLTTPLYVRLLTESEYGKVSVFLTWESLLGIIAMFCLSYGVFNNGMVDYPDRRDEYSFSMLILSNLITIVFLAALLCVYPLVRPWLEIDLPLLILMGTIFLFQPAYNFWVNRQRYELRYKASTIWTIVCAVSSPLAAILCILHTHENHLYARLFGAYGILIIIYIGFYIHLVVKARGKLNIKFWKSAFLFNLPLIPHYLSTNLLSSADKLMISWQVNDAATAYYSVAYSVAVVVTIIWTAANASLIPYTYERCKEKDYPAISSVTNLLLTGFAAACILLILLAPEIVAVMATQNYRQAIYVIPPIVGGVFFQVQYFIYANIIYYYKRPKYVMYASLSCALLNVGLNYIFISKFGYIAAGYTTIFSYFVQAVFDYFAMKKVVKEPVYNMKYIGALSGGILLISITSSILYQDTVLRYGIIALLCILCFLFRKKIAVKFVLFAGIKKKSIRRKTDESLNS